MGFAARPAGLRHFLARRGPSVLRRIARTKDASGLCHVQFHDAYARTYAWPSAAGARERVVTVARAMIDRA